MIGVRVWLTDIVLVVWEVLLEMSKEESFKMSQIILNFCPFDLGVVPSMYSLIGMWEECIDRFVV